MHYALREGFRRQASPAARWRAIAADVFWYSQAMKRLLGEQPERRPIPGPAISWAKKSRVAAKTKDLRRSSTAAEVSRFDAKRDRAAVWAICALAETLQFRHRLGESRQIARIGEVKSAKIVTECSLNIPAT